MKSHSEVRPEQAPAETFDEWAESTISELADMVNALRVELLALRRRVRHLERGAGCGVFHPSDLLEGPR